MKGWKEIEIQALNDYLSWKMFNEPVKDDVYTFEIEDLKIEVKPTGDYNFELTFNGEGTTENALEIVGDTIIETLKFWLYNNDVEIDELWEEILTAKDKSKLSSTARKIADKINVAMDKEIARDSIGSASRLVIVIGLPTSGKKYQLNKKHSGMYAIDSDNIQKLMKGHEDDHPEWTHGRSKEIEMNLLKKAFERGDSFAWVTTGINATRLKEVISEAHAHKFAVDLLYIKADNAACMTINRSKTAQVPEHILNEMITGLDLAYETICSLVDKCNVILLSGKDEAKKNG